MILFSSTRSLLIFHLLDLPVTDRGMLKLLIIIVNSFISPCSSIDFCLDALLLVAYTISKDCYVFLNKWPLYHNLISFNQTLWIQSTLSLPLGITKLLITEALLATKTLIIKYYSSTPLDLHSSFLNWCLSLLDYKLHKNRDFALLIVAAQGSGYSINIYWFELNKINSVSITTHFTRPLKEKLNSFVNKMCAN